MCAIIWMHVYAGWDQGRMFQIQTSKDIKSFWLSEARSLRGHGVFSVNMSEVPGEAKQSLCSPTLASFPGLLAHLIVKEMSHT